MKWLTSPMLVFDRLVSFVVGSSIADVDLKEFQNREGGFDSEPGRVLYSSLNSTDVRSTAILQHVSIMIAVSGLLFSQSKEGSCFRFIFALELLCYVLLTLACLRLLIDGSSYERPYNTDLQKEALWKEKVQFRTGQLTFLVTIALAATVFLKVIS